MKNFLSKFNFHILGFVVVLKVILLAHTLIILRTDRWIQKINIVKWISVFTGRIKRKQSLIYLFVIFFALKITNKIDALSFQNLQNNLPSILYYDADDDIKLNPKTGVIELNKNASFLFGNTIVATIVIRTSHT